MSDGYPVSQLDCDHDPISALPHNDRMELLVMGETVECERCGMVFGPKGNWVVGEVYLVREDVERL